MPEGVLIHPGSRQSRGCEEGRGGEVGDDLEVKQKALVGLQIASKLTGFEAFPGAVSSPNPCTALSVWKPQREGNHRLAKQAGGGLAVVLFWRPGTTVHRWPLGVRKQACWRPLEAAGTLEQLLPSHTAFTAHSSEENPPGGPPARGPGRPGFSINKRGYLYRPL